MARAKTGLHHEVSKYAKSVVSGKLKANCCKWEILACKRHLEDLKKQENINFQYIFDETRANRIINFFKQCNHVRGIYAGQSIQLQPWQIFDQGCLYGWVRKVDGARRFNRAYQKRARGNVKSTEVSVKCLYHMTADVIYPPYKLDLAKFENEPEVECAAVDRGQAKRVFDDACKIAIGSPKVLERMIIKRTRVEHKIRGGFMRALSKDTKNKDSGAPCYFEVDEYHAHPSSEIYDIGFNSFGKRSQSLLDVITTAGDDAENKPCKKEEDFAKKVLESGGNLDENYFVMIREIDDDDNPHDNKSWIKANPILRYPNEYSETILRQIETEYNAAYQSGEPEKIRKFLTRRLCKWQSSSVNKYMDGLMDKVKTLAISSEEFAELTENKTCNIGFDLGKRIDLSGVAAVFILDDGRVAIKTHSFMPENGADRHEKTDRVPYKYWSENGYCTLTPGDVTDNSYIDNWICDNERKYGWKINEIDYDGHNATDLAIKISNERGENSVVEISQTCAGLNGATKGFREMVMQGKLIYEQNPLFEWCLGNAIVIENNFGDIKLSKRHKNDTQRIDPVAAMMNALARVMVQTQNDRDINKIILGEDWSL